MDRVAAFIAYQFHSLLLRRLRLLPLDGILLSAVSMQLPLVVSSAFSQRSIFPLLVEGHLMRSVLSTSRTIRIDRGWNLQLSSKRRADRPYLRFDLKSCIAE